jgi:hypothetical protein
MMGGAGNRPRAAAMILSFSLFALCLAADIGAYFLPGGGLPWLPPFLFALLPALLLASAILALARARGFGKLGLFLKKKVALHMLFDLSFLYFILVLGNELFGLVPALPGGALLVFTSAGMLLSSFCAAAFASLADPGP